MFKRPQHLLRSELQGDRTTWVSTCVALMTSKRVPGGKNHFKVVKLSTSSPALFHAFEFLLSVFATKSAQLKRTLYLAHSGGS